MSDLSMYELEDIVWDEFGQSDDHIVPHPSDEHAFQDDSYKKPRHEVTCVSSAAGSQYAGKRARQGKGERDFQTLNKRWNTKMEKDPWTHTPDSLLSASCDSDSIKEVTSLTSDNMRMPSHCFKSSNTDSIGSELCSEDPILSDRRTAVDSTSYDYQLNHISQPDNELSFFNNDCVDKESSDLLDYGWPDIGNFEDVDMMFRSCDSSFGLGDAGNEDELGWFSSSDAIGGSEDALKSDLKFSCPDSNTLKNISESHEPSQLYNENSSIDDSIMKSASFSYKACSRPLEIDEPATLSHLSFFNGPNQISESKDELMHKEQGVESNGEIHFNISTIKQSKNDKGTINLLKKKPKVRNQTEGKRKQKRLENGGLYHHVGNQQLKDIHLPPGDTFNKFFTSGIRKQKQGLGPDSFAYLRTNIPYSDYCHPSDQTTVSATLSGIKSGNNGLKSLSPKESSYASNQVQSMESSHDLSFEATAIALDDNKEKLNVRHGFHPSSTSNPKHADLVVNASICDSVSVPKQIHHPGNEIENRSDVEGVSTGITELGSSSVKESSSMNSGLDEISLEATCFRQLQRVTEQLDLRTKLFIRDSLYRLARSAEQRHNYANLNGGSGDDRDTSGGLMAEGTNKCTEFMDMETDTNPIDRSIAHLLFHRPSESSVMPTHNVLPLKSRAMMS